MAEWEKAVKTLKEEIVRNGEEIKLAIKASEANLLMKIEELNHRVSSLEVENCHLSNKIETLEILNKKNNIIIFGLDKPELQTPNQICQELKNCLKIDVELTDLNNAYPLKTTGEGKPIKVEFVSYLKKAEIFKNCKNLKGTGISIANDLTYKQRQENRILRSYLNSVRQTYPEDKTYIRGNKLFINNRAYTVEELEESDRIHPGERRVVSAPPTPQRRKENETHPKVPELNSNKETSKEITCQLTTEENPSTPPAQNSKKNTKSSAAAQPKDRVKSLRSGSTSSNRH